MLEGTLKPSGHEIFSKRYLKLHFLNQKDLELPLTDTILTTINLQVQSTMKKIREVLADRHLSRDQAYQLISQKYLRDIFPSPAAPEEEHLEPVDPAAPVDNERLQEIQISRS